MAYNILIGQSGGPTVAINATLAGAVKQAMKTSGIGHIYGALNGIEGILQHSIVDLRKSFTDVEDFERLAATPAMVLGSCRFKLPEAYTEVYEQVRAIFHQYQIHCFFYIGGNDSMDTVKKLSAYFEHVGEDIQCIGIPKTIDNDLPCTDHTPGFGSAAKYIASCIAEVAQDSSVYDTASVTIFEIMGRNAGWLTASAALARVGGSEAPHLIYLPELAFDPEDFIEQIRSLQQAHRHVVVAVSEGVKLANGRYVASAGTGTDAFGHVSLSGVGRYLEQLVRDRLACKVRSVELNVLQRSAAHLGSATDLEEAAAIGAEAIRLALRGKTGIMLIFRRMSNAPYLVEIDYEEVGRVANHEKTVPGGWIAENGHDITPEMVEYLKPLVKGRAPRYEVEGIPSFFKLDKTHIELE